MNDVITPVTHSDKKKKNKRTVFNLKTLLIIIAFVLVLGGGAYYWFEVRGNDSSESVTENNLQESERVLTSLNLILYTESEKDPTVARIENPDVLRESNADFYKNAQKGDYLILYPQRAVVYRESENTIINVAPIINTDNITPKDTQN